MLATILSGVMLMAIGYLRLGTYIKFIPYPVTVGFTAGIAVIIFASQIKDLLGLTCAGTEPGPFVPKLTALCVEAVRRSIAAAARPRARQHRRCIVGLAALAAALAGHADRRRAGGARDRAARLAGRDDRHPVSAAFPQSLPMPALPHLSLAKIEAVLPDAIAFALLGAIEIAAVGGRRRRHDRPPPSLELRAGRRRASPISPRPCSAASASPGTIARTATNVRAGARGPISGMLHSLFLLLFILVAAPLASYIPLAALAGVLAIVAGTWWRSDAVRGSCCEPRAATLRCCWRPSGSRCSAT